MNGNTNLITTILIVILCTLFSQNATAQEANVSELWSVQVKDGQAEKFEAALKKHMQARDTANDPFYWTTSVSFIGDNIGHYVMHTCCATWADHDNYAQWNKNSKMNDNWNKNVDRYVKKYQHRMGISDLEHNNWPEDSSDIQFVGVREFSVRPGRARSLHVIKNRMSQAAKAGNWDRHWSWTDWSGGTDALTLVTPFKNFADMAPPDTHFLDFLAEQLESNEAAQKAWATFTESYTASKYTVYQVRRDLSSTIKK